MTMSKTIEVDLGAQREGVERRVDSGDYEDASDVIREALTALDERDALLDGMLRADVEASIADQRPGIPIDEAFKRAKARIAQYAKDSERDA